MPDSTEIVLYTTEPCGFCRQAKSLLQSRGVNYREINLAKDSEGRADLVAFGKAFIANPALVERLRRNAPHAAADP